MKVYAGEQKYLLYNEKMNYNFILFYWIKTHTVKQIKK